MRAAGKPPASEGVASRPKTPVRLRNHLRLDVEITSGYAIPVNLVTSLVQDWGDGADNKAFPALLEHDRSLACCIMVPRSSSPS